MTAPIEESATLAVRDWTLRRIDIRSPASPDGWPVARLELQHPVRGRVTDIGTAPGAFDAAFLAAGQIVGVSPTLLSYNVRSAPALPGKSLPITVEVGIELDGARSTGASAGVDLVRCSVEAWLNAIHRLPACSPVSRMTDRG
jgi:2-isopropylmalate synthase